MTAPDPRLDAIKKRAAAYKDHGTPGLHAPQDRAHLLSVVEAQAGQIAKVRELHQVETRWTHPEVHGSLDTREEAAEYDYDDAMGDPEKSLVDSFEVCAECGRIEGDQLRDVGEIWDFRESIWPCLTIAALAPEGPEA